MTKKIILNYNVLDAALMRLRWTFDTFPRVCISFSGGKDSTVMFHLAAIVARQLKRRFHVLFIDWEAQFSHTIAHVEAMISEYRDLIEETYWVSLPLKTLNSVSLHQPEWVCWQEGVEWVRLPPDMAITKSDFFPFYRSEMTFEEFIPCFSDWFSQNRSAAILVGIRADESLQRFQSIASQVKRRFADDKPWTTASQKGHAWNIYPLYDWKTADIWTWFSHSGATCNPLYNLMYQAGVPLRYMRICEPFGPEQRQGLWLYHVLEPDCWARLCNRVSGANSGRRYAGKRGDYFAVRQLRRPTCHPTWRSYALYLLNSLPESTAEHYRNKIYLYLRWYKSHGFPDDIPDEQDKDLGSKDTPSWRRICKVLLRNDYWCRALSFSPNKASNYVKYSNRIKAQRLAGGLNESKII